MAKAVKLAPDYSSKAGYGINAYDAPDERGREKHKEAFLVASKALLRAVARIMAQDGYKHVITSNRAGISVSGDTYGKFCKPDYAEVLHVTITSVVGLGRASDGVTIYVQVRNPRGGIISGNHYLSADLDSDELAEELNRIIERIRA